MPIFTAAPAARIVRVLAPIDASTQTFNAKDPQLGANIAASVGEGTRLLAAFAAWFKRTPHLFAVTGTEVLGFTARVMKEPTAPRYRVPLESIEDVVLSFRTGLVRKAVAGAAPSLEIALRGDGIDGYGFGEVGSATRALTLLRNAVAIAQGADAHRFWIDAEVVACHGLPVHAGETVLLAFGDHDVAVVADREHRGSITYRGLRTVDVAGGEHRSNAGIIGGGFGPKGAAKGIVAASVINNLSDAAGISTVLHLSGAQVDATFVTSHALPADLDIVIPAVRTGIHASDDGTPDAVERLERLHSLHQSGALSTTEFDELKADLLTHREAPEGSTAAVAVPHAPTLLAVAAGRGGEYAVPQAPIGDNEDPAAAPAPTLAPTTAPGRLLSWVRRRPIVAVVAVFGILLVAGGIGRAVQDRPMTITTSELAEHLRSNLEAAEGSGTQVDTINCDAGTVRTGEDAECWVSVDGGNTLRLVITPRWDGTGWGLQVHAPGGDPAIGDDAISEDDEGSATSAVDAEPDDPLLDAEDGVCYSEADPDCDLPPAEEECAEGETLVETGACEPMQGAGSAWDTLGPDFEGWDGSLLPDGTCPDNFHIIGVSAPYCEPDF